MKYQVGCLTDIQKDDPEFDTEEAAIKHAVDKSVESERKEMLLQPYGIWSGQEFGSRILLIAYGDKIFAPRVEEPAQPQDEEHAHPTYQEWMETYKPKCDGRGVPMSTNLANGLAFAAATYLDQPIIHLWEYVKVENGFVTERCCYYVTEKPWPQSKKVLVRVGPDKVIRPAE